VDAWGHIRPLCAFVARVVLSRHIHITLFTIPLLYERVKTEIARGFGPSDTGRRQLVRVISLDNLAEGGREHWTEHYVVSFAVAFAQLMAEKPVTCHATKVEYPAVPAPKVVVIDFTMGQLAQIVHNCPNVKAIGFCCGMASHGYLCFSPTERGGRSAFKAQAITEAKKNGKPVTEVADEIVRNFSGDITQIPGLPKMYHWEHDAQLNTIFAKGLLGVIFLGSFDLYHTCDGMILASPEVYEPQAIAAMKEWFAETSRAVWAVGPLSAPADRQQAIFHEEAQSKKSTDIRNFLNDALTERGEHSVLYISFGSMYWPPEAEKLEVFIDTVLEKKIPFILSHASPLARISDCLRAKVDQSKMGLLSPWSPQQTILIHPAVGWFVTHTGHNSVLEAVQSGVPLICWPFGADQPANAVNLTENHDAAYELLEVRTGNGLKPRYRTGMAPVGTMDAIRAEARDVFNKAFGEDGARKRKNVRKLQQQFASAWDKGGSSDVDMTRFLNTL